MNALSAPATISVGVPPEVHAFMPVDGEQVYAVHHHAQGRPRAAILLCGPIGAERERAYRTQVELARLLAREGFETMRFDYRGIGESTGKFEALGFGDWKRDAETCAAALRVDNPDIPLALWGVRAGAILASECFRDGLGASAMLCAGLGGAQAMLMETLRRTLMAEMMASKGAPRATRDEIVASLERGELVNVDGYFWSRRLWTEAAAHGLAVPPPEERRPWLVVDVTGHPKTPLAGHAEANRRTVPADRFWEASSNLIPRGTAMFDLTLAWARTLAEAGP